jgi:hypothetical protein
MAENNDETHGLPSLAIVLGYIAVKEYPKLDDKVRVLTRLGYGNVEMAKICGTSAGVISTVKWNVTKGKKGKEPKKGKVKKK